LFSPFASDEANAALGALADHFAARRYIVETTEPAPNLGGASHYAGPAAGHAGELALDLAGGAVDPVIMLDGRLELSPLAIGELERLGSVSLADTHSAVTRASAVVIAAPGLGADSGHVTDESGARSTLEAKAPAHPSRAEIIERLNLLLGAAADKAAGTHLPEPDGSPLARVRRSTTLIGMVAPPPPSDAESGPFTAGGIVEPGGRARTQTIGLFPGLSA